jgi:hypothetical protein
VIKLKCPDVIMAETLAHVSQKTVKKTDIYIEINGGKFRHVF